MPTQSEVVSDTALAVIAPTVIAPEPRAGYPRRPQSYTAPLADPTAQLALIEIPDDGGVVEGEIVSPTGADILPAASFIEVDIVKLWLRTKTSPHTQRNYETDIEQFFDEQFSVEATPGNVLRFLSLRRRDLALIIANYCATLKEGELSPATQGRRLAALRSLLSFAYKLELCESDGRGLGEAPKVIALRDTLGIKPAQVKKLWQQPLKRYCKCKARCAGHCKNHPAVLRDVAILRLLCENVLRRGEVESLDIGDFLFDSCELWIVGKGTSGQRQRVTLSAPTSSAIQAYLVTTGSDGDKGPLFVSLDRNPIYHGERLSAKSIYNMVKKYGEMIGVQGLRPHKLRHSGITAALDATGGNVREVQKLSRHKKLDTLLIYDDNRSDMQGKVTHLLSGLFR